MICEMKPMRMRDPVDGEWEDAVDGDDEIQISTRDGNGWYSRISIKHRR